ncbi:hypothetical protein LCGC14_1479530 [marine sediment metagenome]|uniref:Uncharacterized protein n=1 Tax=marine sediment metagenome TaxID=412755 RepID=A0A0F9JAJ5_9ZZZZ
MEGLGACPRCRGSVFRDRDHYGPYLECLMCGYLENLDDRALRFEEAMRSDHERGLFDRERPVVISG